MDRLATSSQSRSVPLFGNTLSNTRAIALLAAVLLSSPAFSQATDASVSGTVTDPTGAHIVGVNVIAVNVATGVATPARTNDAGVYVFASLPPGKYRLTAEHSGFRKAVISDLDLEVGAQLTINMPLELGATTETVEVKATASDVNTTSSSVGDVVNGKKLLDLPLAGRSVYNLLSTQAGVITGGVTATGLYINGNRTGTVNFTTDGINTQDNLLNSLFQANVSNTVSVDRAEEFRIVTSPADAEVGRGAGQVQMVTRGGTNQFHGSLWEEHRNTDLNANNWFNNAQGNDPATRQMISPRNVLIRNQFGGRLGGPIRHNKTFFNGIYEADRQNQRIAQTQTVYTQSARQGIFRFFPGVQNGNATAAVPTVDLSGNPVQPSTATGSIQSLSVFGRDPNRLTADPTGIVSAYLGLTPLPNSFRTGDGLNTAGFTWSVPVINTFDLYETRLDHILNEKHRMNFVFTHQAYSSINVAGRQPFPAAPPGLAPTETTQYSASITSVFRPNLLNELRVGVFRPRTEIIAPYDPASGGTKILPATAGGVSYLLGFANVAAPLAATSYASDDSNRITQNFQYGDSLTWIKGRHTFKGGVEARLISSAGYDAYAVQPRAIIGNSAVTPVQNISNIAGIGSNSGTATNQLLDLTGSIADYFQVNNSPGGPNPVFIPGETRYRNVQAHEYSGFFKDDFKLTPSFTLNLGVRYEWYAVPTEELARGLAPVGGGAAVFGISGTDFSSLFHPGIANGSPTTIQLIGPGTPNPNTKLYNNDNNNFAPAVGFAWSLPWFGRNKTTIRAGYGMGYERIPLYVVHNNSGLEPGLSETDLIVPTSLVTVGNLKLPVSPLGAPLAPVPLTGTGSHTQTMYAFDKNLRTPYTQNYNFTIQRALSANTSLSVGFVGSKGTKLIRSVDTNEVNVFENGILQAFQTIQAGGTSPLMEQLFGAGGSNSLRTNSTTQGFFANNNVGGFANYISTTTAVSGIVGGLLPKAGLPLNFVVANPQFLTTYLTGNFGNSTYNSLQVQLNRRFSNGFTFQASYVFSKALGDEEGDGSALLSNYRTLRNERLDKRRLSFDRTNVWKANGLYELPFGAGKTFGRNSKGVLDRLIGGWQTGAIFNLYSGQPITLNAQNTINNFSTSAGFTPNIVGEFPAGSVQKVGNGVVYFNGLTQITDPSTVNLVTNLRKLSTLRAIAAANGTPLLVNPEPGQLGTLGQAALTGPGAFQLDVNLLKRIKVTESVMIQVGATANNLTNTANFGNPNTNINSLTFGRITAAGTPRIIVLQGRINF